MNSPLHKRNTLRCIAFALALLPLSAIAQSMQDPPFGRPDAVIDLATREGAQIVKGQWRYHDVKICLLYTSPSPRD